MMTKPEHLGLIRLVAMDVDGVLTDGRIGWSAVSSGELCESKTFSVRDGLGIGLARAGGLEIAWITGRSSAVVAKRAQELKVTHLRQGARDKSRLLAALAAELGLPREAVLYIGDDVNDLLAFEAAGVRVAVADAEEIVRRTADWITQARGGEGAVREVIEGVLAAQGLLDEARTRFLAGLREEQAVMQ